MLKNPKLFKVGSQRIYNLEKKEEIFVTLHESKFLDYLVKVDFKYRWLFLKYFLRFREALPKKYMGKMLNILSSLEAKDYQSITDLLLNIPERHRLLCNKFFHIKFIKNLSKVKSEDREAVLKEFEVFSKIVHPKDWEQILDKLINVKFPEQESISGLLLASFPQDLLFPPFPDSVPNFMNSSGPAVSSEIINNLLDIYTKGIHLQEFKDFVDYVQIINEITNIKKKPKRFLDIIKMIGDSKVEARASLVKTIKSLYAVFPKLTFSQMSLIFSSFGTSAEKITSYMIDTHNSKNAFELTKSNIDKLLGYFSNIYIHESEKELNDFLDFLTAHKVNSLTDIKELSQMPAEKWPRELKKMKPLTSNFQETGSSRSSDDSSSSNADDMRR